MKFKERVVLIALSALSAVPGFSQSRVQQEKEKFAEYIEQQHQGFSQYKQGQMAQFEDLRQGRKSKQAQPGTEPAADVDYARVAATDFGLGESVDCRQVDIKDGKHAYIATSAQGTAVIYESKYGFGANLNADGGVNFFSLKRGVKTPLDASRDKQKIALLKLIDKVYGADVLPIDARPQAQPQQAAMPITQDTLQAPKKVTQPQQAATPVTQDTLQAAKKVTQPAPAPAEVAIKHRTADNITYYEEGNKIVFKGVRRYNVDRIMPKIERKKGMIYCGSHCAKVESSLRAAVIPALQRLVTENSVYNDLLKREQQGETLSKVEQGFKKLHVENLAKEGIVITADGKLQQKNPQAQFAFQTSKVLGG